MGKPPRNRSSPRGESSLDYQGGASSTPSNGRGKEDSPWRTFFLACAFQKFALASEGK